jgi:hypothetical protein
MLRGFKEFVLRGNVVDLAVGVVIGAAFGAVVAALVKDLITPLIAAIVGKPDFSAIGLTVNGSRLLVGDFLNALISLCWWRRRFIFSWWRPSTRWWPGGSAERRLPIRRRRSARSA